MQYAAVHRRANWLQQQVLEGAQEKSLKMMSQSFVIFQAFDE